MNQRPKGRKSRKNRPWRTRSPPEGRQRQGMKEHPPDLARYTLGVLIIVALIAASFWILRPFLPALIWATMIVVFTWHIMLHIQRWLWNRRSLAVTVMTLV